MSIFMSLMLLQAATPAPTTAAEPPTTPRDDLKIVCKVLYPTGTRVGSERICLPKKEWRRMHENGQEATREIQDHHSKRGPF